jgi:hypothetical protein
MARRAWRRQCGRGFGASHRRRTRGAANGGAAGACAAAGWPRCITAYAAQDLDGDARRRKSRITAAACWRRRGIAHHRPRRARASCGIERGVYLTATTRQTEAAAGGGVFGYHCKRMASAQRCVNGCKHRVALRSAARQSAALAHQACAPHAQRAYQRACARSAQRFAGAALRIILSPWQTLRCDMTLWRAAAIVIFRNGARAARRMFPRHGWRFARWFASPAALAYLRRRAIAQCCANIIARQRGGGIEINGVA